ncbi:MAG: pyridoxamine 5'-phosphate oxidase family protein [Rhodocyclaceae bacterium]|nr:pyridoxamine 5'-phosphate oxidase family protein [Rhodocyclaceae bacterium]
MKLDPREARNVLAAADFVALATQSARLAGFPFVSHAPFARDGEGAPLLLLSRLAEHSRNLAADPRASLMVTLGDGDPQSQPRVTLVGELRPVSVSPDRQDRYLRFHPEAGGFLGFGDFRFYGFETLRVRLVGGFARAGWIEAAEWRARPLPEGREKALLVELGGAPKGAGRRPIGIDWDGLDLRDGQGARRRITFRQTPADEAALLAACRDALAGAS